MKVLSAGVLLVLAAACGGGRTAPMEGPGPVMASATQVVDEFMLAVADSNLTRMSQLWGTTRGSAAMTGEPADWQRRMIVTQLYLRGGTHKLSGNISLGSDDRRQVTLEFDRGGCTKQVPFTVARLNSGSWLVIGVDISAAGNPARPCGVT